MVCWEVVNKVCNLVKTNRSLGDSHRYFCIVSEKLLPQRYVNLTTNKKNHITANVL